MKTIKFARLGDLASITTLQTFRDKAPDYTDQGDAYGLSIKDLTGAWPQPLTLLPKISIMPGHGGECVADGDILMPGRGTAYPARYYARGSERLFTLGQVYVIRPHDKLIGRYLAWYLNQSECQGILKSQISGTTVMSLKKSSLTAIEVAVPSADVQQRIGEFNALNDSRTLLQSMLTIKQRIELDSACKLILSSEQL
ncbi:MAG: restriction endonuclease subunit S [Massilia sp.]